MPEFSAIDKHLKLFPKDSSVHIGIGDDAAMVECPEDSYIVQTLDVMVESVHFDASYSASELAHKLLHVNLSDIAAMGAQPKWATIGMVVPTLNDGWLKDFSNSMKEQAEHFGVSLIGGDTSQGAFVLSLNLTGLVKKSTGVLTRSGAKQGDDIYVSGTLGDAALALEVQHKDNVDLQQRLRRPQARVELGPALLPLASACLDVSDGLLQDLGHICEQSQVAAQINVEQLPLSEAYQLASNTPDYALNGGDDYELCFTAHKDNREELAKLSQAIGLPLSRVGTILADESIKKSERNESGETAVNCLLNGEPYHCQRKAWQHFESEA